MNLNHQELPLGNIGQSPGCDPKSPKRNSGLFSFLKWFKPSSSRESIDTIDLQNSHSSSCDSLNSIQSNGTVASFSYIPPGAYINRVLEKCIVPGPETDTYKARLKQRDKRRENDKNLTLRKKYNLFFNRETLLKNKEDKEEEENTKSLPLMTRTTMDSEEELKMHRRTNSESSKIKRAGAYLHVKGKRKAPQPPGLKKSTDGTSTMSLRRKKRLAPVPPPIISSAEKLVNSLNTIEYADIDATDILFNDSLKLDHGILKSTKASFDNQNNSVNSPNTSARSSFIETPVSPKPWYKRNTSRDSSKSDHKYEPIEKLPEVQYIRNMIEEETKLKKDDKRKSGLSFLTNISELDREASEIVKKAELQKNGLTEIPPFMRPKEEPSTNKVNAESWVSPKRRSSARDLIAKFNAITNVTKVTVFGVSPKRDYFGKQLSLNEDRKQESLLESHKKKLEEIDNKFNNSPLMKSESASAIKAKPERDRETPKLERKSWNCPKCSIENDYWRIICHVCSTIKPYFDDLTAPITQSASPKKEIEYKSKSPEKILMERSKTQIGFSALASYNANKNKKLDKSVLTDETSKREEREKLKKMLIEMKNSLPKRKSNNALNGNKNNRASVIVENPEIGEIKPILEEKSQEAKIAEILIGTSETIYENIKVRKDNAKPIKVSASAQTNSFFNQAENKEKVESKKNITINQPSHNKTTENKEKTDNKKIITKNKQIESRKSIIEENSKLDQIGEIAKLSKVEVTKIAKNEDATISKTNNFELMKPKDFEDIYSDTNAQSTARIYANLAKNDELSLFFNMPKRFNEIKNISGNSSTENTDTIEINRLLRRLESAIAKGELTQASIFAKELAQLKINCSVIRQKPQNLHQKKQGFTVEMYVEDKISHRGPFPIEVTENQTVAELKAQIQKEFEIPINVQRWILGKELATDDNASLKNHQITNEGCPVFLYLVAPDAKISQSKMKKENQEIAASTSSQISNQKKSVIETKPKLIVSVLEEKKDNHAPKIVKVIPKVVESFEIKIEPKIEVAPKINQAKEANEISNKATFEEDFEDYDSKTLKPQPKEWECHLCTLLNPTSSNICAVCATVRQNASLKKSHKKKAAPQPQLNKASSSKNDQTYLQLVNLDNADLVENVEPFECLVCFLEIQPNQGVTLRECLHQFCKLCLANTVEYNEDVQVKCPYRDDQYSCNIALQDREIKALVRPQIYEQYLAKSVAQAENKIGKSFHCKTPDCKGWCIFEDNVNEFRCPVCKKINCLTCQAIHVGLNCKQYQEKMNEQSEVDEDAKRTKEMLEEMVNKGEALNCPTCHVILMKKWGCDWLRCSMCKTEICWVTRGPRWGPAGKGDTSGGCQCGVNGVKCHPKCNYCH